MKFNNFSKKVLFFAMTFLFFVPLFLFAQTTDIPVDTPTDWYDNIGSLIMTIGKWVIAAVSILEIILRLVPSETPTFSFLQSFLNILQKIVNLIHTIFPDFKELPEGESRNLSTEKKFRIGSNPAWFE